MHPVGARLSDVCFVHWPVDADVLGTRLPRALSVATREGAGWVSLLGMRTRPMAGPVALPGAFSQVTLRTYVQAGADTAVYFLRVDVDSRLAARAGRTVFGLPFHHVDASVDPGEGVRVRTHSPGGTVLFDATFDRAEDPEPAADALAARLTDRDTYALADGRTGVVDHEPWRFAAVDVDVRSDEMLSAEGLPDPIGSPLVRYSPGTDFRMAAWPS